MEGIISTQVLICKNITSIDISMFLPCKTLAQILDPYEKYTFL